MKKLSKLIVFEKPALQAPMSKECFTLKAERQDAMKGRLRARSEATNQEIAIDLPRGGIVRDGSIFGPSPEGHYYKVEIIPEKVVRVNVAGDQQDAATWIKLGYYIGNRHLEALIDGESVCIPVSIGEDKIRDILGKSGLPLRVETEERVVPLRSANYFAGEDEE